MATECPFHTREFWGLGLMSKTIERHGFDLSPNF
jgi:hypothetical protein